MKFFSSARRKWCLSLFLFCLLLAGCWNRREIETLSFVLAAGIDSAKQGCLMSVQVANTEAMTKEARTKARSYFTFSATGNTIFDAIRRITHISPHRLFWSHTKVLVISEKLAKRGIRRYLDFFARDAEERRTFLLVVTPDDPLHILQAKVETTKIPVMALNFILENIESTSTSAKLKLNDFLRQLHSPSGSLMPLVRIVKGQATKESYYVSGAAAFKKDVFIGELTPIETRGVLWVKGEVKGGIIVAKCPNAKKDTLTERISFEIFKAKAEVKAVKKNNRIMINVKIKEEGNLAEGTCLENEIIPTEIKKLEKVKEDKIKSEIEAALKKAQKQFHTDLFGFGDAINRTYPKEWKKIEKKWDQEFSRLQVKIEVESKITGNALIQRRKKVDQ